MKKTHTLIFLFSRLRTMHHSFFNPQSSPLTLSLLYLEKLAGEDESEQQEEPRCSIKELRAAPGAACLGCLDTAKLRLA